MEAVPEVCVRGCSLRRLRGRGEPLRLRGTTQRGWRSGGLANLCRPGGRAPAGIHEQEDEDRASGLRVEGRDLHVNGPQGHPRAGPLPARHPPGHPEQVRDFGQEEQEEMVEGIRIRDRWNR